MESWQFLSIDAGQFCLFSIEVQFESLLKFSIYVPNLVKICGMNFAVK